APFPVKLRVDLERRATPTIEAVAFFIVSEALTNIAKHAAATRAEVSVRRERDRLHVLVYDDGCGGARLDGGTGLRGLAQRIDAVDGTLRLSSPLGGPTTIDVELPCE
ncbi:MAG TPA: ATP-binding protein, partial [Nonomuraea sp.]|nr:ATP-binding protein [Nonomuraea sp.]